MNISVNKLSDHIVVVTPDESVLQDHIPHFKERMLNLLEENSYQIILNLENSLYLSSLALSVLIELKKKLNYLGGDIILVNVGRLIENLLKVTNLFPVFKIVGSIDEALIFFAEKKG